MFAFVFSPFGRFSRRHWWGTGGLQILGLGGLVIYIMQMPDIENPRTSLIGPVFFLLLGIILWMGMMANIKRFHDRGKSGFWVFISFVPVVGAVWLFTELGMLPGDEGDNVYGPPPGAAARKEGLEREISALTSASSSNLAKLDDDYFRNYAAQMASTPPTGSPLTSSPAATHKPAFGASAAGPVFGRRV